MNNFRNVLLLSLSLFGGASATAQGNSVTFGVNPGQTTTGGGQIGVTVGGYGYTPVNVPPGTDSAGIATATAAALTAQGFTAQQNGTEVTVTAGPGGAPLTSGGGIGSTDPGITGVKTKVTPPPGPGPGGGPGGGAGPGAGKQNGGNVPKANPQNQAQAGGSIQVDVEVLKFVNGQWVLLWIQVVIPIFPGDDGAAVNQRVRQQLQAQGLIVRDITLPPSVAPITPNCFGMDRTQDGGRVQSVGVTTTGGAHQVLDGVQAGAGQVPQHGASEYDRSIDENGIATTDWFRFDGNTGIGQGGVLDAHVLPNQFGLWFVAPGSGSPFDLQAPWIPLPFVGPGFDMPLDPFGALLLPGISDPLGGMQLPLPIPPDPQLAGLELQMTAVTIDPLGGGLFDGIRRTNAVTLRVGD